VLNLIFHLRHTITLFIYFRGTIGVHDVIVGEKCSLYLGKEGNTKRTGVFPDKGLFDFEKITVAAGGEITSTADLTGANDIINIKVIDSIQLKTCIKIESATF
jgi:hypothetical protein